MNILKTFIFSIFLFCSFGSVAQNSAAPIECSKFQTQIKATKNAIVLDVRSEGEFQSGHLVGAKNLNYNAADFTNQVTKLDKNRTYFVYCAAGVRSARAASVMRAQGFKNVIELKGGINAWLAEKYPITK